MKESLDRLILLYHIRGERAPDGTLEAKRMKRTSEGCTVELPP